MLLFSRRLTGNVLFNIMLLNVGSLSGKDTLGELSNSLGSVVLSFIRKSSCDLLEFMLSTIEHICCWLNTNKLQYINARD